jgi:L-histidine N-alpha-methyltransferase
MEPILTLDRVTVRSYLEADAESSLADDVLDGLTRPFKELPPKHFYDAVGADLFDQICDQPEYYPTRAEREILQLRSAEIAELTRAAELVELGSGTAAKTRVLLDALRAAQTLRRYVPFDVTEGMVREVATAIAAEYDGVEVHGIVGDFERHLDHIPAPVAGEPRIIAFLGGTIGNFTPGSRRGFLRAMAGLLGDGDHLLLGTDLVKDPDVLEAAYNDDAGVTAAFNRNVLCVLNRELDADFDPAAFEHVAFFDREHEWIEMRLRAQHRMVVPIRGLGMEVAFEAREEVRTEISAKFTPERLQSDLGAAGLELVALLTDPQERFALSLSRVAPRSPRAASPRFRR